MSNQTQGSKQAPESNTGQNQPNRPGTQKQQESNQQQPNRSGQGQSGSSSSSKTSSGSR